MGEGMKGLDKYLKRNHSFFLLLGSFQMHAATFQRSMMLANPIEHELVDR